MESGGMTNGDHKSRLKRKRVALCEGCGRPIRPYFSVNDPGDRAIDIREGAVLSDERRSPGRPPKETKDGFRAKKVWGRMHFECFSRSMESSDSFLDSFLSGAS